MMEENDDVMLSEMFSLKNKKKKKVVKEIGENIICSLEYDPPTYTYQDLLAKLYENMDIQEEKKLSTTLRTPIVQRIGAKKTGWMNFKECCTGINISDPKNIINYLKGELSADMSIDGNGYLLIRGIFKQQVIESILRKYVVQHIQCHTCKNIDTTSRKDVHSRLTFIDCPLCKSSRNITYIQSKKG